MNPECWYSNEHNDDDDDDDEATYRHRHSVFVFCDALKFKKTSMFLKPFWKNQLSPWNEKRTPHHPITATITKIPDLVASSASFSFCYNRSMADISQYKVGIVLSVEECSGSNKSNNTPLRSCRVNVGQEDNNSAVTIVTSASNVRPGSRVAVALAGSCVINEEGEEMTVKKTIVGGISSDGMLCDSRMLGWSGGAAGVAAQMPDSIPVGEAPPRTKPRPNQGQQQEQQDATANDSAPGLFEKKLTKEEKKKLAEEKRKAKKAAKEAKNASEE